MYQVYVALTPSNTYYVGITSQGFEVRKSQHVYRALNNVSNTPFYKAIRKYTNEVEWFVLANGLTKSEACELEKEYIAKYKNLFEVYNVTPGGELPWNTGTKGLCPRSEESLAKQKISRQGYSHSSETREKMARAHTGRVWSQESKIKNARTSYNARLLLDSKDGCLEFLSLSEFSAHFGVTLKVAITRIKNGRINEYSITKTRIQPE